MHCPSSKGQAVVLRSEYQRPTHIHDRITCHSVQKQYRNIFVKIRLSGDRLMKRLTQFRLSPQAASSTTSSTSDINLTFFTILTDEERSTMMLWTRHAIRSSANFISRDTRQSTAIKSTRKQSSIKTPRISLVVVRSLRKACDTTCIPTKNNERVRASRRRLSYKIFQLS